MNNAYSNSPAPLDLRAISVWNAENTRARREYVYGADLLNSACPACTLEATCWRCRSKARGYLKVATSQVECAEPLTIIDRPSPFAAQPTPRKPPRPRPPCGTNKAYQSHYRHDEPACDPCKAAHAAYMVEQRRKNGEGAV